MTTVPTIIAYVDDADYALPLLHAAGTAQHQNTHWILVACAPRITHRISKFVSNRSRESWRNKWAQRLFDACVPLLQGPQVRVTTMLARTPLPELLQQLLVEHGAGCQVIDLRRPKDAATGPAEGAGLRLQRLAGTLTGVGALWGMLLGEVLAA